MDCCDKKYLDVNKYILHIQCTHGSDTFVCPFAKCHRSFHLRYVFKKHLTSHVSDNIIYAADANLSVASNISLSSCTNDANNTGGAAAPTIKPAELVENDFDHTFTNNPLYDTFEETLGTATANLIATLYNNSSLTRSAVQLMVINLSCWVVLI